MALLPAQQGIAVCFRRNQGESAFRVSYEVEFDETDQVAASQ